TRPARSKRTVAGIVRIDAAHRVGGNELDGHRPGLDVTFILHEMHVIAARVDESRAGRVDGRPALRIVALGDGHSPRRNDDEAVTWMRMPTGASTRIPDVLLHIDVRHPLGLLP